MDQDPRDKKGLDDVQVATDDVRDLNEFEKKDSERQSVSIIKPQVILRKIYTTP